MLIYVFFSFSELILNMELKYLNAHYDRKLKRKFSIVVESIKQLLVALWGSLLVLSFSVLALSLARLLLVFRLNNFVIFVSDFVVRSSCSPFN